MAFWLYQLDTMTRCRRQVPDAVFARWIGLWPIRTAESSHGVVNEELAAAFLAVVFVLMQDEAIVA